MLLIKAPVRLVLQTLGHFWKPKKDISKDTVLITGAAMGLGKGLAKRFAALGCRLVLWDINFEELGNTSKEISAEFPQVDVFTFKVDLSNRDDIYAAADRVKKEVGTVTILVNNAGIVTGKPILECPDHLMELTMKVNTIAHFWTVKAFLPAMLEQNHGHIVTIASQAGHCGVAGLADYCASKFGAVGFDESLRMELRKMNKTGVKTTCVCPYVINTGMFDGAKDKFIPMLQQKYVEKKIVQAVLTNQEVLMLPRFCYLLTPIKGLFPVDIYDDLCELTGTRELMDSFKGRAKKD